MSWLVIVILLALIASVVGAILWRRRRRHQIEMIRICLDGLIKRDVQ